MSDLKKQVTIIIPAFNREQYIEKAIDSSLEQTYKCKIIVCDHGSTDSTPDKVRSYGNKIEYIRRDKDFGPHFCWLEAVLNSTTEYIHFQFDDDWLDPYFIEKTIKHMDKDVGFAFSKAKTFNETTNDVREILSLEKKLGVSTGVFLSKRLEKVILKKRMMISPGAALYRKQDVLDALYQGNIPVKKSAQYHGVGPDHLVTLLAILRYKKFAYVNEPLSYFRSHEGSITIDASSDQKKLNKLEKAYEEIRHYYVLLKYFSVIQGIRNKRIAIRRSVKALGKKITKFFK